MYIFHCKSSLLPPQTDVHAGLPFLEEEAEERKGGGEDDFSSDLSEDGDDDGGGAKHPAQPRVGLLAAEGDRHSEFSVSVDEDELSNPNEKKSGGLEAKSKSKSIFDETDESSDEGGGLFDRRPPAMMTPFQGDEATANGEEDSERDEKDDTPVRDDKDGRKEIIKPKPVKPVLLGFAAELARKIGAPPPSSRPQAENDPEANKTGAGGAGVVARRHKSSSPPETKNENLEVVKVHKSRSAGNARERSNNSTKGSLEEDSSSEDELFKPTGAARRTDGPPTTSRARHALFDSDSDSDGGLFTGGSNSLYTGKVLVSDTGSNIPRQERESITKSNLEYHSAPNKIRSNDDIDVRMPQSWLARKSPDKKTLFEDYNDEVDGGMLSFQKIPAFGEKKHVDERSENPVMPQNEEVMVKDLNDKILTDNSSINETASKYPQEGFGYTVKEATPSNISEVQPYCEKEEVERMDTREENMVVNSGQTESSTPKPTIDDKFSKMSNQKMTATRRKASLKDIFGDDSDSDDIFSTLRVQSRKVINSDINSVDNKVPNDKGLSINETVRFESLEKNVMKKTDKRRNIFGSFTDDVDVDGRRFGKTTPQENSPSVLAEKGGGGLFASSSDEDNIFEVNTDEGPGLASKVISKSMHFSDNRELGRDCADGNASSRETHPNKQRSDKTSGDDDVDEDEETAAAMATRFGGARPKSWLSRTQNDGDIKDDAAAVTERPKRLHVPQFGTAFRNSLSATLAKGPMSPGSVSGRSLTPGETSAEVTTPPPKKEQKAEQTVDKTRDVDEDPGLLIGAVKYRAKMARPKRRPPSRYMRQKSPRQKDDVDFSNLAQRYATSRTHGLSEQEVRSDVGSSPDLSRLPPQMPPELSRSSEDSASVGTNTTKSPSSVGNEEIDETTKETEVSPPRPEKTELPTYNEEGIEKQASMATDERMNVTEVENRGPRTHRPAAGEVGGKEEKADMSLHNGEEHTPNALRTEKSKAKGSLFESSSDSEDLFAKKPLQDVAAVGNVGMKPRLFESSSDSDDLFSSAKRKS